ncbi:Uncharacterized protein TPAR_07974 [Tolypocladium paradoxum]|uniref:2EXR domain-containing protein n=1 Tax=Tolypocladium paradoxum TaxID=94208 RepID=A0A2S4KNP2_9HYPO|nr:Uncharacterized protein TPAR_07974 [Tolypocladium paradoxum]
MASSTTAHDAETATQQTAEASSDGVTFGFNGLPREVRDLIWEATLPPSRVFHVSGSHDARETRHHAPSVPPTQSFKFYVHHPPPAATRICRESRAVALRRGFFLSPQEAAPGVWFSPERDMLYFDRNMRYLFTVRTREGKPLVSVEGLDRVLNIGMSWRAWFRDVPRLMPGEDMRRHWRAAMDPLFLYAPRMQTVNFVLPKVRHVGGVTFGREAYGAASYPCELVPLPETTGLPWDKMPRPGSPGVAGVGVALLTGGTSCLTPWGAIRREMERSLEVGEGAEALEEDEWGRVVEGRGMERRVPRVLGWWLLRVGAPTNYEQQQVREFSS